MEVVAQSDQSLLSSLSCQGRAPAGYFSHEHFKLRENWLLFP